MGSGLDDFLGGPVYGPLKAPRPAAVPTPRPESVLSATGPGRPLPGPIGGLEALPAALEDLEQALDSLSETLAQWVVLANKVELLAGAASRARIALGKLPKDKVQHDDGSC